MREIKIKVKMECSSCDGTGLYRGFAESKGVAVICNTCKGTGCEVVEIKGKEFKERKSRKDVQRVYLVNPGIGIGESNRYKFEDFGGMPYLDWENGKPFPKKSEMREFTCPAQWYQIADCNKKPTWDECIFCGSFSSCKFFKTKDKCWERWDKQFNSNK